MVSVELIKIILILLITSGGIYSLFSIIFVCEFFRSKKEVVSVVPYTPVSVIKPLKGMDPELRENLRSFCTQNYPEYEILLGFTEPTDDAMPAAKEIVHSSTCGARIVISREDLGVNQKVSNLHGLFEAGRYPLVAMSDSDMRVDSSYLERIVKEYYSDKHVGLVTSLYKISNPASLGSAFESLAVALDFIPSVIVARRLEGVSFGLGASMLLSREAIEEIGGFSVIADYLADDYQLGNRLWTRGYNIILSRHVIENVIGDLGVAEYFVHQLRWARTYRACRPKGFLGYGITHIFPFSLLLLLLLGPTPLSLSILGCVLALRFSLALVIYGKVIRTRKWLKWLALLPFKEVMSFGIWVWSFFGRQVFWRGRYYRIVHGGRIELV